MAGRRIDMRELAAEIGVNRATLFRWVGSRDDLLAEILWSLAEPTLALALDGARGRGGQRIVQTMDRFAVMVDSADYFREFLRREPERALGILTTRASVVQQRFVAAVETILREEITHAPLRLPLPPHDLSYLIVRIVESFLYADIITGQQLDIARAQQGLTALLGAPGTATE